MVNLLYLSAAVCFIFALKGLSSASSSRGGNLFGVVGMGLACFAVALSSSNIGLAMIAMAIGGMIGIFIAQRVSMTELPEMVAGFHSLVGLSALLIDFSACFSPQLFNICDSSGRIFMSSLFEIGVGGAIGAVTFTGSVIAFMKLRGIYKGRAIPLSFNFMLLALILLTILVFVVTGESTYFVIAAILSLIFGITFIVPIGGADMPVVVSMLNSYSGWAASGIGFTLHNDLLIITGALVGASGAILSYIMCKGMNRSLFEVLFSMGESIAVSDGNKDHNRSYKQGAPEDAAFLLKNATSVIIVPGYGMATSQAQHSLKEMSDILKKEGVSVKYAIHPVAGRMPGHMNVLLAEANVPYEDVFELDEINNDFASCDVAFVVGANDVTNPAAKNDPTSSIYGMPILEVSKAKTVLFLKRSMSPGYAGVDNELFYASNTMLLLGDAKKTTEAIIKVL